MIKLQNYSDASYYGSILNNNYNNLNKIDESIINNYFVLKNNTEFIPICCLLNISEDKIYSSKSSRVKIDIINKIKMVRASFTISDAIPVDFYKNYMDEIDKMDFSFIDKLIDEDIITNNYRKICGYNTVSGHNLIINILKSMFSKFHNYERSKDKKIISFMYYTFMKKLLFSLVVYKDKIIEFKRDLLVNNVINPKNCEIWIDYDFISKRKEIFNKFIISEVCPYLVLNGFIVKNIKDINDKLFYDYTINYNSIEELENMERNFSEEFLSEFKYVCDLDFTKEIEIENISNEDCMTNMFLHTDTNTNIGIGTISPHLLDLESSVTTNVQNFNLVHSVENEINDIFNEEETSTNNNQNNNENELIMSFLEEELNL